MSRNCDTRFEPSNSLNLNEVIGNLELLSINLSKRFVQIIDARSNQEVDVLLESLSNMINDIIELYADLLFLSRNNTFIKNMTNLQNLYDFSQSSKTKLGRFCSSKNKQILVDMYKFYLNENIDLIEALKGRRIGTDCMEIRNISRTSSYSFTKVEQLNLNEILEREKLFLNVCRGFSRIGSEGDLSVFIYDYFQSLLKLKSAIHPRYLNWNISRERKNQYMEIVDLIDEEHDLLVGPRDISNRAWIRITKLRVLERKIENDYNLLKHHSLHYNHNERNHSIQENGGSSWQFWKSRSRAVSESCIRDSKF